MTEWKYAGYTGVPDREKVIKWLEACSVGCEEGCPYEYDGLVSKVECKADLMRDALELLKEQEPRVLNIVELKNFAVIWFEARNHLYIEPMLTRGKNFADESTDWFRYGKEWRCWTSKPTIEQRKAVKWDESQ